MAKSKTAPKSPPVAASPESPTAAPAPPAAEYTVVARRYRPQQFPDLIGQEHVATALSNAIASGRIAHAYLFTGARGTGKTSTARILAKALNCVHGPTATPCDKCDICLSIAAGDDPDVIEIDAASNTGVENIRELRGNVGFRPQRARYKIYIIDEVHMLSNSAFNALLKTLEEPPPHVKFIFATTEVQKIPVTILSRCQRFDFAHIGSTKVFETLKHIAGKEGLAADDEALRIVARRAAGSMRDAQTILDQLLGSASGRLTAEVVHSLFGSAGEERVIELAEAIFAGDAHRALEIVAESAERGAHVGELADQMIDFYRGMMLVAVGGPAVRDLPGSPNLQDRLRSLAPTIDLDVILSGIDILTAAKAKMRGSSHAQVVLEVAVIRLARLGELLSVSELAKLVSSGSPVPTPAGKGGSTSSKSVGSGVPNGDPSKKNALRGNEETVQNGKNSQGFAQERERTDRPVSGESFPKIWERVLQEIGPVRGNHLRQAGIPAIIGPNALAIRFPVAYSAGYEACGSDEGLAAIRTTLRRISGNEWTVRVEKGHSNGPVPEPLPAPVQPADRKKDLLQLPLFRRANEILGAQLMRVDDGFAPTGGPRERPTTPAAPASEPELDEV